jgi:hypothetical protein
VILFNRIRVNMFKKIGGFLPQTILHSTGKPEDEKPGDLANDADNYSPDVEIHKTPGGNKTKYHGNHDEEDHACITLCLSVHL